jgi:hypothetical protein
MSKGSSFIISLFLVLSFNLTAQKNKEDKQKGELRTYIDNSGNEVQAYFNYQNPNRDRRNNVGIRPGTLFVYEGNKLKEKLTAEDISAVVLDSMTLYSISMKQKVLGKEVIEKEFARKHVEGALDLYYIKLSTTREIGGIPQTTIGDVICIRKQGSDHFISFMMPKKAKKEFIKLIADNSELYNEVDKMGTFKFLKMHQEVVVNYNEWANKNK